MISQMREHELLIFGTLLPLVARYKILWLKVSKMLKEWIHTSIHGKGVFFTVLDLETARLLGVKKAQNILFQFI